MWVVASFLIWVSGISFKFIPSISDHPCTLRHAADCFLTLALVVPWPLMICTGFSPLQLPHVVITVCCPCRCLTLEGTAHRNAAAEAAITSATEVGNTRDGGHGRDRAAVSVTVGTVGKTVTMFDPGGESGEMRLDPKPCGASPAWPEADVVSPASGWPRPCSLACSEL